MPNLPKAVRAYMRKLGAKGGATTGTTKARDPAKMRAAALKRWDRRKQSSLLP